MCGITGLMAFNEIGRFAMINLSNATEALAHRGPDAGRLYNDHFVGLGHRRLAIIDTSPAAHQPMSDAAERYWIVFNGEIFNYRSLRAQLEQAGEQFATESDTEVLLRLYMREGKACLQKLNGFFAFCIYDKEAQSLFLARDRMGIKPLWYYIDEDKLLFASELKSLLQYGIEKQLDTVSLFQYLQLNYTTAPDSMLKGVQKLLPGHCALLQKGDLHIEKYYQIDNHYLENYPNIVQSQSYSARQKQLEALLDDAVQQRLVADVPLGAFLSGGIDSSVVVALAARQQPHLHTFSIGYRDEPFFDETKYARLVAKKCNTEHTVFSLSNDDLYEHLFDMLHSLDEPFADSSALAVYILSKKTRKHVKVALSGDGADELFAGYNKHHGEYKMRKGGLAMRTVVALEGLWKKLPKSRNSSFGNKVRQLHRFANGAQLTERERYWQWAGFATELQAEALMSQELRKNFDEEIYDRRKDTLLRFIKDSKYELENLNEVLYTDMQMVLPNDMLTKVDAMSMAHALEVRVPFLDHRLVDFVFSLPLSDKINATHRKRILKDTFRHLLPKELYHRPKQGFEVPLLSWMRGPLRRTIEQEWLQDDYIAAQGIFDVEAVRALKQQLFSANPEDVHARIWALIVFQHWYKKVFS